MNDRSILERVHELVEEERTLRASSPGSEAAVRLASLEEELDRCWDLLRQRRALREAGDDPDRAEVRDAATVERYSG